MAETDKATEATTEEKRPEDALGDAGKKALAEERDARRKAESELSELRRFKAEVERDRLIDEIADAKGLTPEMRDALAGDDRETLEAHADKLKALVPKSDSRGLGRPKEAFPENLTPGASNEDDDGTLSAKKAAEIADKIPL